MPSGRCAGCGYTNSDRKTAQHVIACDDFTVLFQSNPGKALNPIAEYRRHKTEEMTADARAARRDVRLTATFEQLSIQQDLQTKRWRTPKDILED